MNKKDDGYIWFTTDDGQEISVDAFVLEPSRDRELQADGVEESEDETIARHLRKAKRIWEGQPEPHFILTNELPKNGFPTHCITAWLSEGDDEIVVVFLCDISEPQWTIGEIFSIHLHDIHWDFLVGNDWEEDRKIFDWYERN